MSDENNVIHLVNWNRIDWNAIENGSIQVMIDLLNKFIMEVTEKFGDTGFIKELTITDKAVRCLMHDGPGPGEFVLIETHAGTVRLKNGGDPEQPHEGEWRQRELPRTLGGYPYVLSQELDNGFWAGEIILPNSEVVHAVWDTEGNPFSLSGWPGRSMAIAKPEARKALPPPEPEPVKVEQGPIDTVTAAGYKCSIVEFGLPNGVRGGIVQLPNGEMIGAYWDLEGNELGGRPKFKISV